MPVNVSAVWRTRLEIPVCCLHQEDTYWLMAFLILDLIFFVSDFESNTVHLHKDGLYAHIIVGRSLDCALSVDLNKNHGNTLHDQLLNVCLLKM